MLHANQFLSMERFLVRIYIAYDQVLFLLADRFWQLLFVLIYKFLNIYACRQILAIFGRTNSFFFNLNYLIILTALTHTRLLLLIKMTFCLLLDVFWLEIFVFRMSKVLYILLRLRSLFHMSPTKLAHIIVTISHRCCWLMHFIWRFSHQLGIWVLKPASIDDFRRTLIRVVTLVWDETPSSIISWQSLCRLVNHTLWMSLVPRQFICSISLTRRNKSIWKLELLDWHVLLLLLLLILGRIILVLSRLWPIKVLFGAALTFWNRVGLLL